MYAQSGGGIVMRVVHTLLISLVMVSMLMGAVACTADRPVEEPKSEAAIDEADERAVERSAQESGIAEWFVGRWMVDFVLTSVSPDKDWSRAAAGQPSAMWDCKVRGSEMLIDTGLHIYNGTLIADGDEWSYDGMAVYLDEEGVEWTSHIVVEGARHGDDSFGAEQWGEISSSTEGTLYAATWDAIGTRAE